MPPANWLTWPFSPPITFRFRKKQIKQLESVLDNRRRQSCVRDWGVLQIGATAAARQPGLVAGENVRRLLAIRFSSGQIGKGGRCDENRRCAKSWLAPRHAEPLVARLRMLCLTCWNGRVATGLAIVNDRLQTLMFPAVSHPRLSWALLILRFFVRVAFIQHGTGKLMHPSEFAAEFGIPVWLALVTMLTN